MITEQSECLTPTNSILSPWISPLQNNHDEIGSFREIHTSGKKGEQFPFLKIQRPFATARLLHL
jgi:hypothetical protein